MVGIGVVIVTWNSSGDIGACLDALRDQEVDVPVDVVVVDNGSTDGTREVVRDRPGVTLVEAGRNAGYAHATNRGIDVARGDTVLLLNPDVVLDRGCLSTLLATLEARCGAVGVGARLRYADGSLQHAALRDPTLLQVLATMTRSGRRVDRWCGRPRQRRRTYADVWRDVVNDPFEVDVQITACLLLRRDALADGAFDERFPLYYNDGDLCRRLRGRGTLLVAPRAGAMHTRGASTRKVPRPRLRAELLTSLFRYADRWWSVRAALVLRFALVLEAVVATLECRLRGHDPEAALPAVLGALGLPGGAEPWFGPPVGWWPDAAMRVVEGRDGAGGASG